MNTQGSKAAPSNVNPYDRAYKEDWYWYAKFYLEKGFSILPCAQNKRPQHAWEQWQQTRPTLREVCQWARQNLGIVTGAISNIIVVDCDTPENAKWWYENHEKTKYIVKTGNGYHFYYKHPGVPVPNGQKVKQRYDIRGDGGYVVAPPSFHSPGRWYKWHHSWHELNDMPVFKVEWRDQQPREEQQDAQQDDQRPRIRGTIDDRLAPHKQVRDGRRYISKIMAIEGSGGDLNTFRAANKLRDSGLSEAEALLALQEWNRTNAKPPWSDLELLHKIRCAYAR